jgi:hypothetical protein
MSELSDQAVRELAEKSGKYTPGEINTYLNKRLNAAAKSSSSATSIDPSLSKKVADAAAAGFYDRFSATKSRLTVDTVESIIKSLGKSVTLNPIQLIQNVLALGLDSAKTILKDTAELQDDLLKSAKGAGGYVGQVGNFMLKGLSEAVIATARLGISVNDFVDATESLMVNSERMALYSEDTIYAGMEASMAYTKNSRILLENAEGFRNVGLGLSDAARAIEDIGKRSVNMGLSAKATSETLIKNLGALNAYGFQNGIKGLGKMVQEAQSLKINMDEILKVADKLYDPESAITLAANLQVVGGAFGDLGDPIKLMYDATNNVESLQTSIIGAARSLATYNAEQGRFEVSGANLRRAKAMSDALGISMSELTNMAVKGAAKFEAMSQLDMFPKLSDEQKEFVSNLATMKDGKVGFDLPKDMAQELGITNLVDGFVSIDDLSSDQVAKLQKLQEQNEKLSTKDIARQQLNATTQMMSVITAMYLRGQKDLTYGETGTKVRGKVQVGSDFLYDTFDASKMNSEQLKNLASDQAMEAIKANMQPYLDKFKEFADDNGIIDAAKQGMKKTQETIDEYIPKAKELMEKGVEKGKEMYKDAKEFFGSVDIKVDINSSSTQLAGIVVDEISKNPQLKAEFVSNIVKNTKAYA